VDGDDLTLGSLARREAILIVLLLYISVSHYQAAFVFACLCVRPAESSSPSRRPPTARRRGTAQWVPIRARVGAWLSIGGLPSSASSHITSHGGISPFDRIPHLERNTSGTTKWSQSSMVPFFFNFCLYFYQHGVSFKKFRTKNCRCR
jgi:hypothetical protein